MPKYFALVPAAGSGTRMGGARPKQYLPLSGYPLIFHALRSLCAHTQIVAVFVVLAQDDILWQAQDWSMLGEKLQPVFCGGDTRAKSVRNGLTIMGEMAKEDDWVLVHDAARPCLKAEHISRLIEEVGGDPVGGILAVPVADTLKRVTEQYRILETLPREGLWHAQTPQMFRYNLLQQALAFNYDATDEASAVELLGLKPKVVASDVTNLKVTYPWDIRLARSILAAQS